MTAMRDTQVGVSIRIPYRLFSAIKRSRPAAESLNHHFGNIVAAGLEAVVGKPDAKPGQEVKP